MLQHLGGHHHVELVVGERQLIGVGVQIAETLAGMPVGPQPRVGEVEAGATSGFWFRSAG